MFGDVKLIKNADSNKYSYSGYSTGFDSCSLFPYSDFDWDKNVVIFGVDNNSSVLTDNKKKYILVLGEGPTPGLDDTMIMAETKYSTNFSRLQIKFSLSLHYHGRNNFLFVNVTKVYYFKAKIFKIKPYQFCLRIISKDFTADNMKKKTGLNGYVHNCSVR